MTRLALALGTGALLMGATPALADKVVHNAVIGGAGGAVAGALIPGLSVGEGALIGGAGGAVVGALDKDKKHRRWYRDDRGNRYYVNKHGRRVYRD